MQRFHCCRHLCYLPSGKCRRLRQSRRRMDCAGNVSSLRSSVICLRAEQCYFLSRKCRRLRLSRRRMDCAGNVSLLRSSVISLLENVVVSVCLERQWTAPEMSVFCGAASTVTLKSNSGKAVFVTVAVSMGCW